ncbi:hypothetical protein BGZ76_005713 [Entomortierella beljakovae]|nr:hypothetical protein BGZ76_005713 [Entomortierella beljakovae]
MASFMSMQYDSDSDSADDRDFEPTSEVSSGSDDNSESDTDDIQAKDGSTNGDINNTLPSTATPSKKTRKTKSASTTPAHVIDTSIATEETSNTAIMAVIPTVATTGAVAIEIAPEASVISGEVVKKKKGPKKGTKYKKRTPAAEGSKSASKSTKNTPKMNKKAAAAAAAAAAVEAARSNQPALSISGHFGFQNTQVDMDHPLETFKWPYSPFTPEFKTQHQARDKVAHDLRQAVQQITDTNGHATWRLQELDNQLQMSRQDLKTSLDEIQFRKSQLRDMSLLAVDIVRKLSSPRPLPPPRRPSSSSISGNESTGGDGTGGYTSSCHLDGDHMDVDGPESGGESKSFDGQDSQQSLKGLNEGNVRSFLERIRALEQAQHHVLA